MEENTKFVVTARDRAGKGAARATRRAGLVPGVLYGDKKAPELIGIDPRLLMAEMQQAGFYTRMFDIELNGKVQRALCRDIQKHPVTDQFTHVDFQRIGAGATIHVAVPIVAINELASPGMKRGGVLNLVEHSVEVAGKPEEIPHKIEIDLTGMEVGDVVHLSQLALPAGVRALAAHDLTVATIAAPSTRAEGVEEGAPAEGEGGPAA